MLRSINGSTISRRARPCEKWFGHDPARGAEFRCRYAAESHQHSEQLSGLRALARHGPITLVFSAHDEVHDEPVALRNLLWDERRSEGPRRHIDSFLEESDAYDGLREDRIAAPRSYRVNSERGGRPSRHERVAAAAGGDRSPHPHRKALDQHLVGATDRSRGNGLR